MTHIITSPLISIPLEIIVIDQHGAPIGEPKPRVKLTGLWEELRCNASLSPVIVAMVDAIIATKEDLYLYADVVIGAHQYYVSQIV